MPIMLILARNRMYRLVRELDPEGVARRRKNAFEHRGAVILPGPNEMWSLDAYCKLEHWGLQIYAAVDAYSRLVVWYYVGISGRTAISVLGQYVATITAGGIIPRKIRTDRGAETTMTADAHYALSNEVRSLENGQALGFSEVFRFGTSKENSMIERWWRQQSFGAILQWRDCFLQYSREGYFIADRKADRIAFLAIYVPIIRHALSEFVHVWNNHKIRKQPKRPYLVSGIPYLLYNYPERTDGEQCGFVIPQDSPMLRDLQESLAGLDLDEYLPEQTLEWCRRTVERLGYPYELTGSEITSSGERIHRLTYIALCEETRSHIATRQFPELHESDKPWNARRWSSNYEPSDAIRKAFDAANEELVQQPHPLDTRQAQDTRLNDDQDRGGDEELDPALMRELQDYVSNLNQS